MTGHFSVLAIINSVSMQDVKFQNRLLDGGGGEPSPAYGLFRKNSKISYVRKKHKVCKQIARVYRYLVPSL